MADEGIGIFISYAPEDEAFVTFLRGRLELKLFHLDAKRVQFWHDHARVGQGDRLDDVTADRLRSAKFMIVVMSPNWLQSSYCVDELYAFSDFHNDDGTHIVLARKDYVDWRKWPFELQGQHGFLFYDLNDYGEVTPFFDHGRVVDGFNDELRNLAVFLEPRIRLMTKGLAPTPLVRRFPSPPVALSIERMIDSARACRRVTAAASKDGHGDTHAEIIENDWTNEQLEESRRQQEEAFARRRQQEEETRNRSEAEAFRRPREEEAFRRRQEEEARKRSEQAERSRMEAERRQEEEAFRRQQKEEERKRTEEAERPARMDAQAERRQDAERQRQEAEAPRLRGHRGLAIGAAAIGAALGAVLVFPDKIGALVGWLVGAFFHGSAPPMPAAKPDTDVADIIAFAPQQAAKGESFLVQVFVGKTGEDEDLVKSAAFASDPATSKRGIASLDVELIDGDRLDIKLEAAGLVLQDSEQSLLWRGQPRSCAFIVAVPGGFPDTHSIIQIRVYLQAIPVGRITFSVPIREQVSSSALSAVGEVSRVYRRAFLSYASPDRPEVIKRAQALRAANIEFFMDLLTLEPGERWERRLYVEIDKCDLFLLFWSSAARNSSWIAKEISYAQQCIEKYSTSDSARPDIHPIIIEGPPPPKPPAALAYMHFNDDFLYLIASMEKLAAIRPTN
jgi:hypothetical protein